MKIANIIFVVITGVFFLSLLGYQALGCVVPMIEVPEKSNLEARSYQQLPGFSIAGVVNGEFQQGFMQCISDHTPNRDTLMLLNALCQRTVIQIANVPFDYYSYHTFFGSNRVYIDDAQAVIYSPARKLTSENRRSIQLFCEGLSNVAALYPDKRFVVFLPAGATIPDIGDEYYLQANDPMTPAEVSALFEDALDNELDNVFFFSDVGKYESVSDYFEHYYRTDHHWNAKGFTDAYNMMAEGLGLNIVDFGEKRDISNYQFSGSHSRQGLMLVKEEVFDSSCDYSNVTFEEEEDEAFVDGNDHHYFYENIANNYRFYENYYTTSTLYRGKESGNALLITDSYGGGIARALATNYKEMHKGMALYGTTKQGNLIQSIEETSPDDIFFIATASDFISLNDRIPSYFEKL